MRTPKPTLLFVTDLYYAAKGRVYHEEDVFLSGRLRDTFDLVLCHPQDTEAFEDQVDGLIFRNTGPVIYYKETYAAMTTRLRAKGARVFNSLTGRADMCGKQYLVDLTDRGFPVIPTVDRAEHIERLPAVPEYVLKRKDGADSIGMHIIAAEDLGTVALENAILQPKIDFEYEISFYFIDRDFQYATYAPNRHERWNMEIYHPSEADLAFAQQFIAWNTISHGIQRVDGCQTQGGELLLVELEDLNPYLSLLEIGSTLQDQFVANLKRALLEMLGP